MDICNSKEEKTAEEIEVTDEFLDLTWGSDPEETRLNMDKLVKIIVDDRRRRGNKTATPDKVADEIARRIAKYK